MNNLDYIKRELKRAGCERVDDATIKSAELKSDEAIVKVETWELKALILRFTGVVYFKSFEFGGNLSEIRLEENSDEIREAVLAIERAGGRAKGYPNLVQLSLVSDDDPLMIVVFQTLEVQS